MVADKLKTAPLTSTEVGRVKDSQKFRQLNQEQIKIIEHNSFLSAITIHHFQEVSISSTGIVQRQSAFSIGFSVNKEDSNISFPGEIIGEIGLLRQKVGVSDPDFGNSSMKFETAKSGQIVFGENCFF